MDELAAEILPSSSSSSSCSQKYVSHLTTLPLQDLLAEPTVLQTQSHHLTSSLTSLTHTSYPTFISLHETTTALTNELFSLSSSLDALLNSSLPALQSSAAEWHGRTDSVLRDRNKARVVLEQHDKIKDLLDIPLLIDTCVRNGYFSEALSLANHALSLPLGSHPPLIIASIQSEVHQSMTHMFLSLLETLHEPNRKLPALWKAVNFLRKMDAFGRSGKYVLHRKHRHATAVLSELAKDGEHDHEAVSSEEMLALAFLSGRMACLKGLLEPISKDIHRLLVPNTLTDSEHSTNKTVSTSLFPNAHQLSDHDKEDVARFLKKYIDIWREGVYDIVTQYTSIFLEQQSETHLPSLSSTSSRTLPPLSLATSERVNSTDKLNTVSTTDKPPNTNTTSASESDKRPLAFPFLPLISNSLLQSHLLPLLNATLPALSLPLLPSLLTQLTYCATAFARIGLDFRPLIGGIMEAAVLRIVKLDLGAVAQTWVKRVGRAMGAKKENLKTNGDTVKQDTSKTTKIKELPSAWLIATSQAHTPPSPLPPKHQQPAHVPPQILASYPPLAQHTNAILTVLNALRMLAPIAIAYELLEFVEGELLSAGAEAVLEYLRAVAVAAGDTFSLEETNEESSASSSMKAEGQEREKHIAQAFGHVYFEAFVPYVRRALLEGVYGIAMEKDEAGTLENGAVAGGRTRLKRAVEDWEALVW